VLVNQLGRPVHHVVTLDLLHRDQFAAQVAAVHKAQPALVVDAIL
jgi:hypothetical protein